MSRTTDKVRQVAFMCDREMFERFTQVCAAQARTPAARLRMMVRDEVEIQWKEPVEPQGFPEVLHSPTLTQQKIDTGLNKVVRSSSVRLKGNQARNRKRSSDG